MIKPKNQNQLDAGYRLHSPRRASEPGYSQMDILIRGIPTSEHFDPEQVRLSVASSSGETCILVVSHPWVGEESYRLCASQIDVIDRKGKHVDAFTFGGELLIQSVDAHTNCILKSPAPLLVENDLDSIPALLSQESEILLAERRAAWAHAPEIFEKHLAAIEPLTLYLACIEAILERYRQIPFSEDEVIVHFKHILKVEAQTLCNEHPEQLILNLEQLL